MDQPVEMALVCEVRDQITSGNKEAWLILKLPDGKEVVVRIGECKVVDIKPREDKT